MISQDINDLIYIAERQSDERLAQELNPETETGMLGPPWLSASELAYRQKIRSEAQAEPSNAPPVVQQLAQTAMPQPLQNNMASVPPAPTGMPQQPMPQQQPMPTQMFASGGKILDPINLMQTPDISSITRLSQGIGGGMGVSDEGTAKWWNPLAGLPHVQYANLVESGEPMQGLPLGNIANLTQDVSELAGVYEPPAKDFFNWDNDEDNPFKNRNKMSAGGLLNYANGGMIDDPYAIDLQSPLISPFPMDTIAPMPQDEFESLYGLGTLTDYEPYAGPTAASGTLGPIAPEVGEAAYPISRQTISPAVEDQLRRLSTDTVSEEFSPFRHRLATAAKGWVMAQKKKLKKK